MTTEFPSTPLAPGSRRAFLRSVVSLGGLVVGGSLLAACQPATSTTAPAAAPTAAPKAAAAPAPTTAPAAAAKPAATSAPASAPAAQPAAKASAAAPTGRIVIAQPSEFLYIDPNVAKASTDSNYHLSVWDSLIDRQPDGTLVPLLAESWTNPVPTEWVFKIRTGVKFHNGDPLTAKDVANTLKRVTTPMKDFKTVHSDYQGIDRWEAVDDTTIRMFTKQPDPLFLGRLIRMYITPADYITRVGDDEFESKPIGSGPYKFIERVKDSHVKLEANTEYWRGSPKVKEVTFRIIPDAATAVAGLKAGEVDIVQNLPPDQFEILNRGQNTKAVGVPSAREPFIWLWPSSPQGGAELKDKRVRQALNYGVNVENITKFVLNGQATRTSTFLPPMTFAYDKTLAPYPYDPEKAKQLLAEAGYPNGIDVVFEVPSSGLTAKPVEVGEAIAADLVKIGVRATVQPREFASWFQAKTDQKGAPLMLWSWGGGDYFDPDPYYRGVLHPSSRYALDTSPGIIELIDQSAATTDQAKRAEIWKQAQALVKDEAWAIFLYDPNDLYGVNKKLNWTPRSDERIVVWNAFYEQ